MEEAIGPPFGVWACNWSTTSTFIAMSTQWRSGFSGLTGMDYNALPVVMRMLGIPRKEWADVLEGIGVMEVKALELMTKMREK